MFEEFKSGKEKYSISDLVIGFVIASIPIVAIVLYGLISGEINFVGDLSNFHFPALGIEGLANASFDGIGSSGDLLNGILIAEVILIGLAIPFTILMVFRFIKDQDRQILKLYLNEKIYLAQYWFFISHIILILFVKLLNINNQYVMLLIYFWAVINLTLFAVLIKRVHQYSTDIPIILLEKTQNLLKKVFSSKKEEKLDDLFVVMSSLLRSAKHGVRQADYNFLKIILDKFTGLTSMFFILKDKNYTKYQILMGMDKDEVIDGELFQGDIWEILKNVPHERSLLNEFLKVFTGIWEEAVQSKNYEIVRNTIECLISLLIDLTGKEGNINPVRKILILFNEFTIKRFQRDGSNKNEFENSAYLETVGWFIRVLSEKEINGKKIDPSYLELMSLHLFKNIQVIENNSQIEIWKDWLKELPAFVFEIQQQSKIRNYSNGFKKIDSNVYNDLDFHGKIEDTICKMEELESRVINFEEYRNWKKSLGELNVLFKREFASANWHELKLEEEILKENMLGRYVSYLILKLLVNLGAYFVYKKRADFVIEFFERIDSKETVSKIPSVISSSKKVKFVLNSFLDLPDEFLIENFEKEHFSQKVYYKKFFITLLMLALNPYSVKSEEKLGALKDIKWVSSKERLKKIDHIVLELENVAYELRENDGEFLESLGISLLKQSEYFDGQLEEIFDLIVKRAGLNRSMEITQSRLSPIQVNHFVETFSQTLVSSLIFYHVYDYFHRIQNRFGWEVDPEVKVQTKRVYPKTHFLESSNISIEEVAFDLANFAAKEMDFLISNKISEHCEKMEPTQTDTILRSYSQTSQVIIFAVGEKASSFIKNSNKFSNRWDDKKNNIDIPGFIGFYQSDEKRIPVFATDISEQAGKLLILEEKKMGKLIHYQPEDFKPYVERGDRKLQFKILEFSKNPKLANKVLREYSDWVSAKCGSQSPKIFLNTQVWIEFLEEYNLRSEFEVMGHWFDFS